MQLQTLVFIKIKTLPLLHQLIIIAFNVKTFLAIWEKPEGLTIYDREWDSRL